MNKAYKVVFNKARGALMVANEVTSSVQKKGTKLVVASALLAAVSGVAFADESASQETQAPTSPYSWSVTSNNQTYNWLAYRFFGQNTTVDTDSSTHVYKTADASNKYVHSAVGTYISTDKTFMNFSENLTINDYTADKDNKGPGNNNVDQIDAIYVAGGKVKFDGSTLSSTVTSNNWGGGNSHLNAFTMDDTSDVEIAADTTDLSVTSTSEQGKATYGIAMNNTGTLSFTGKKLSITVKTATDRGEKGNKKNIYSESLGIDAWKGVFKSSAGSDIVVNMTSTGSTKTTNGTDGASSVAGVKLEGGGVNLGGSLTVNASANGGNAFAIAADNYFYNTSLGENYGNSTGTFADVNLTAKSEKADAYGISATKTKDPSQGVNTVLVDVKGKTVIDVTANADVGNAYGVAVKNGTSVTLEGDATIKATAKTAANAYALYLEKGTLTMTGENIDLTGNVKVDKDSTLNFSKTGTVNLTGKLDAAGAVTLDKALTATEVAVYGNGKVTVNGTLASSKITITRGESDTADIEIGKNGTLITGASQVFTTIDGYLDEDASKITAEGAASLKTGVTATGGTIKLTDSLYYTDDSLTKLMTGLGNKTVLDVSALTHYLKPGEDSKLIDNVLKPDEDVVATTTTTTDTTTGQTAATLTITNTAAKTITVKAEATEGQEAKTIDELTIEASSGASGGVVQVTGDAADSKPLVAGSDGKAIETVKVEGLTLQVGSTAGGAETQGSLKTLEIASGAGLDVVNAAASVQDLVLEGAAKVTIGNNENRGALKLNTLTLDATSVIFLDPAFKDDAPLATTAGASHLEIAALDATGVAGKLVAGRNSVIAIGGTAADVDAALAKFSLAWGANDITAALYAGSTIDVASTGAVVVDGSLTAAPLSYTTGTVTLADNALLVVDQAKVGDTAINGTLAGTAKSVVGVVNATEGEFTLAKDGVTGLGDKVLTDNVFVSGKLDGNTVKTTVDNAALGGAIASLGIQQMARRADTVMANTVADRTSRTIAGNGVSLWADVGGERYEADDLANGAQYKANMFYGAFGGDVGVVEGLRVGAAVQYGTGDSKSHNYGIKNDIDAIGFTLYGAYDVASACKLVGEIAYTQTSNDISSSNAQLKNDVDADVFSVGVRGQHTFVAGPVEIIPSIGVRYSRISTDAFNVGAIRVDADDQNIWQVPLSVTVAAKGIEAAGWTMNPYVKASFTPTFGDDEISFRGYDQDALDTLPVQGDFGLSASYGSVTLGAGLQAGFGKDGAQSWGGKVNVRYAF